MMISKMIRRKKGLMISKMDGLNLNGLKWSLLIKMKIKKRKMMSNKILVDGLQHLFSNLTIHKLIIHFKMKTRKIKILTINHRLKLL